MSALSSVWVGVYVCVCVMCMDVGEAESEQCAQLRLTMHRKLVNNNVQGNL